MTPLNDQNLLQAYQTGQRHFQEIELEADDFLEKNLPEIAFHQSFLAVDFRAANLQGARFQHCNLKTCDFRGANLRDAYFEEVLLCGAHFEGADIQGATFVNCYYHSARLEQADMEAWVEEKYNFNQ